MADYVLVHGGGRDGSVWDEVVTLLVGEGNRAFAPSLHLSESATLAEHVSQVCSLFEEHELRAVILVGHSYATFVITGVADKMPERLRRLVFIDCIIPRSGKSMYQMFEELGFKSENKDLPRDLPCFEPLCFDEDRLRRMPKTYVHCTESEFIAVGRPAYQEVKANARRDNWDYYEIDSDHSVMTAHPDELAEILLLKA